MFLAHFYGQIKTVKQNTRHRLNATHLELTLAHLVLTRAPGESGGGGAEWEVSAAQDVVILCRQVTKHNNL
jgi:hypothetical protein